MKLTKRAVLRAGAAALAAPTTMAAFAADRYPQRPVQLVVAYPPGGGTDTLARIIAEALRREIGQSVVVMNRAGAAGLIGTTAAARAEPDGYTLLLDTGNATLRPAIDPSTPFKPSDFAPIALLTESPVALAVSKSLPVNSVAELLSYSRSHPREINYASTGPGSPQNLVTELLKRHAGLDWLQVPYQGGAPALTDLAAGRVHVMFSNPVPLMPYAKTGHLKVLAVTSAARLPALPEVPTMAEAGQADFVIGFWNGVLAPAGAPPAVIAQLGAALLKVMADAKVQEALVRQGSVLMPLGPEPFAAYMARDTARWKQVAATIQYRAAA
jgi:tripartite-type tricarboxylate transporter receptor subunit TctC